MLIEPLGIEGAFVVTPRQIADDRGRFLEAFRGDLLASHVGHRPDIVQTNVSVSSKGTVRGIHFADIPPGQGKYVTAMTGALVDFVIDVRVGSPTYGQWDSVVLDTIDRRAVYISEGLGHAFCALEDDTTAMYLCTATYNPSGEHGIHPFDADVALDLPTELGSTLSAKDASAPSLAEAQSSGLLPTYAGWQAHMSALRDRPRTN